MQKVIKIIGIVLIMQLAALQGSGFSETDEERILRLNDSALVMVNDNPERAFPFLMNILNQAKESNSELGIATTTKNIGNYYFLTFNNDSAKYFYNEALKGFQKLKNNKGISAINNNLGLIYQETAHFDEALKCFRISMEMDRETGDYVGALNSASNIAIVLNYKGRYAEGVRIIEEAISKVKINSETEDIYCRAMINHATNLADLKRYKEAMDDYDQIEKVAKRRGWNGYLLNCKVNRGAHLVNMGKFAEAEKLLNQAAAEAEETENLSLLSNSLESLAIIKSERGLYTEANDLLLQALKINEDLEQNWKVARIFSNMAFNFSSQNRNEEAENYFTKSLEIASELDAREIMADCYQGLAAIEADKGDFAAADSLRKLFVPLYKEIYGQQAENERSGLGQLDLISVLKWLAAFLILGFVMRLSYFYSRKDN